MPAMMRILIQIILLNVPLLVFGQVKSDGENAHETATVKPIDTKVAQHGGASLQPKPASDFDRFKPVELKADQNRKPRIRENEEELLKQKAKGPGPKDRLQPVR
jgi:hypothetical protein